MKAAFPYKVLIVDDHPFQLAYLRELFGRAGVSDLHVASNGKEALWMLERESFSLVLSDLMMPGLDGVQLIQRLAEWGNCPPVALMTAMPRRMLKNVAGVAAALGIEVVDQVVKPATPEAIRRLLERLDSTREPCRRRTPRRPRTYRREQIELALSAGQIQAWFQPKLHLSSGRIIAAEALARWCHPQEGGADAR
ncbi:response regulator [Pseudomonas aeruginosa]|uniref:response regulator n=1 Tax=Pseudomonas aeruginosa TaxID=287 RepID=UPI0021566AB1|nr:response regulator [Pseudomonas aeruginosa]